MDGNLYVECYWRFLLPASMCQEPEIEYIYYTYTLPSFFALLPVVLINSHTSEFPNLSSQGLVRGSSGRVNPQYVPQLF